MPTLNIEGRKVKIDDSFLSMSPEQQNATVEEIAGTLGITPQQPQQQTVNTQGKSDAAGPQMSPAMSAVGGALQGASFGFADELAAGVDVGVKALQGDFNVSDNFNAALERGQKVFASAEDQNPKSFTAGQVGGAIASSIVPGGAALKGATTLAGAAARGAGAGAIAGGVTGFGEGEGGIENRIDGAVKGAEFGSFVGGSLPIFGRAVTKLFKSKGVDLPTSESVKKEAQTLYKQADDSGIMIKPPVYQRLVGQMVNRAAKSGARDFLTPDSKAALQVLKGQLGTTPALSELSNFKQLFSDVVRKNTGVDGKKNPDGRIASIMLSHLDDFAKTLTHKTTFATKPGVTVHDVVGITKKANKLWARQRKIDLVDDVVFKATNNSSVNYTNANIDDAIRRGLKSIVNNRKKFSAFDAQEKKAILKLVRPGIGQRAAHKVGKFAPTGLISSVGGSSAGFVAAGPVGAVAVPVIGSVARKLSEQANTQSLSKLQHLLRTGAPIPKREVSRLEKLLTAGGINQGQFLPGQN